MKKIFFDCVYDIAKNNPEFVFIKGDTAYIPEYQAAFPNQYLDVGIAEQNMIGVAAGMALEGKRPFTYSIVNFATMRCLEQIRNDIAYHNLNVTVVSCGQGFDYGSLGATHHATEDLAIMRAIPDIKIFCPCDPVETESCVYAAFENKGPCFIRNGHGGEPILHKSKIKDFEIGKAYPLLEGKDIIICVTGSIAREALEAAEKLIKEGLDVGVYSFPTVKPIDKDFIIDKMNSAKLMVSVEEHSIIGGLGSAISEVIAEIPSHTATFKKIGIQDTFAHVIGSREYLKEYYGISTESIVKKIKKNI